MKRRLRIPENLQTLIRHLAPELKRRVRSSLDEIKQSPESGKSLVENLQGLRSYKLGQFRILYREGEVIEIVAIGPRKTIYQKVALEIKRSSHV